MARLPAVKMEQIRTEDQPYFDEIVESRGGIKGPYGVLLHSPKLAARVAATGAYVRFESDMTDALKEVVILATARGISSQFEFTSHARLAREAGVSEGTIRAIAQGTAPKGLSGDEELVVRYAQELVRDCKVSQATFSAANDHFGERGIVELTVLIGHYLLVGHVLAAFEVELDPGVAPELPL